MLLSVQFLDTYFRALEENGVQPSTQNANISRLRQGVEFLALSLSDCDLPKVERVKHIMRNWGSVLGKEARRRNRIHLEDITVAQVERPYRGRQAFETTKVFMTSLQ